ncbi:MAG: YdiU family protein [Gammaproteobacteria bacterium]|nr:YdiU family protein [Gammaproteobacteria bacterium]
MKSAAPAFDNTFARLPERFFERRKPAPVAAPRLIRINRPLAEELGIDPDWLAGPEGLAVLAGNDVPEAAEPIAQAYAGHQFGALVPQLGDGRAVLLGEIVDVHGRRRDLQLKGSGRTAFSRGGDGRAGLGPVLREYVVSEAMAALGIPTTRALAAVMTGEAVFRDRPVPGAVLARTAASHIRVGTFEYFAIRRDVAALRLLTDHAIARHYPEAAQAERPALAFLASVAAAQAALIAKWMLVGFIHGVMNTDNTAISGETIDYGPCAFMDGYDPGAVFSSIDHGGRYAYGNQPRIAQWNLARLAEALLPLIDHDQDRAVALATAVLEEFPRRFEAAIEAGWCRKIALPEATGADVALALDLLRLMAEQRADFTLTFRALGDALTGKASGEAARNLFDDPESFDAWAARWRDRLAALDADPADRRAALHKVNPRFIPRNHRVEAVITAAVEREDFGPFETLLGVLARPYDDQPGRDEYALPPRPEERVTQTFCGT